MKKTIISIAFFLFTLGGLHAQENFTAAGGEATGSGGIASYSVGQIVYTTNTGTNGSVAQGVQQPYEIFTVSGINETSVQLELSVYPNPTADYLTLKTEDFKTSTLNFQLFNIQGKLIEDKRITGNATIIHLERQAASVYFLKIIKDKQPIKTFKIIKN